MFEPIYKDYIWGGTRIAKFYRRSVNKTVCAESWEISDRPEGMSIVTNGTAAGTTLHDLTKSMGVRLVGTSSPSPVFPLLIKILDAKERLSVQVHPGENTAQMLNAVPKTEAWYILATEPGAMVYAGFTPGLNKNSLKTALLKENIETVLNQIAVHEGDVVFVPGGRVHSIAEGCLILEVQQNSNTTYRLHDWKRLTNDGHPRELHIKEALNAINWNDNKPTLLKPRLIPHKSKNPVWDLIACSHFQIIRIDMAKPDDVLNDGRSFHALFVTRGSAIVSHNEQEYALSAGTSCLLPAAIHNYGLRPTSTGTQILRISLP
ncbi:MAG: class I mannose-6-phosphate isomerase [Lentisphaerae bacterium]|nr:class I mannose-6-phosphate isomerase [Lentisphaerota bacterium]